MAKSKRYRKKIVKSQKSSHPDSLGELIKQKNELEQLELFYIQKALESNDPQAYVEAQTHIQNIQERKKSDLRSFTFDPHNNYYTGQGYKYKPQGLNPDLLRNMANTPQIRAIINTRIEQAGNFNGVTTDPLMPGWTIKKKQGLFDEDKGLTSKEKKEIEAIVHFLEHGGNKNEWDFDGWETFSHKLYEDSWSLDQGVFEVAVDRVGRPTEFDTYDGGTFFLAEHNIQNDKDREKLEAYMINGYLPRYVQVVHNRVLREYYPWELCFGTRNAYNWMRLNGYGLSENEVLIQVITWMLNSNQYNGNFFTQGSNPKGILNFRDNVDPTKLEEFKQAWRSTLSGTHNSHKLAAMSGGNLEWINMQLSNRDMEFSKWNEFLTVLGCVVFRIDPSEVGFAIEGGKSMFGQDGQKERLRHSFEKGLEPFLKFWEKKFTKYLVAPLSEGRYEFKFTGLEPDDEEANLDRDIKVLTNGGMSVQDFFMKHSNRELDINKDLLLNQVMLQYKQLQQAGDPESNAAVDEDAGESYNNPYNEDTEKSESDPFQKALNGYLDKFAKEI
jgi:hypothetical protein